MPDIRLLDEPVFILLQSKRKRQEVKDEKEKAKKYKEFKF